MTERGKLREYLLGGLPEAETEEIDLRLIRDPAWGERLSSVEEELIEDFLEESLSEAEMPLFTSNFLTPERAEQVRELSLIRGYARSVVVDEPKTAIVEERSDPSPWLAAFFRPWAIAAAVIVIAIGGFAVWRSVAPGGLSETEIVYAELNRGDLTVPQSGAIQLSPGVFRDQTTQANVRTSSMPDRVLLRLALMYDAAPETDLRAEVVKNGKVVFTIPNAKIYNSGAGKEVRILLPRSAIDTGAYEIKLLDNANGRAMDSYLFTAE